jgi:hypothetical protein
LSEDRFLERLSRGYRELKDNSEGDVIQEIALLSWTREYLTGLEHHFGARQAVSERIGTSPMGSWFQCCHCKKVSPLPNGAPAICPLCISSKGQSLSQEHFEEAHKAGSIFDWDPKNRDTVSSIRKSRKSRSRRVHSGGTKGKGSCRQIWPEGGRSSTAPEIQQASSDQPCLQGRAHPSSSGGYSRERLSCRHDLDREFRGCHNPRL